jgi:GNAT superfamily N-acetyltransferase
MSTPCTPSKSVVSLRNASRSDYDAIRVVVRAAYGQYQSLLEGRLYRRYLDDLLDIDMHAARGRLIVAELDGAIAASAAFHPEATVQGLGWPAGWASGRGLAVHPAARGRGVARAMLTNFEQLARQSHAAAFGFHTAEFMTAAVALYQRMGYERAPRTTPTSARSSALRPNGRSARSPSTAA